MCNRNRMLNTQKKHNIQYQLYSNINKRPEIERRKKKKDNAKALYLKSRWLGLVSRPRSLSSLSSLGPPRLDSGPDERAGEDVSLPWDLECLVPRGPDHDLTIQVHPLHPRIGACSGLEELAKVTWCATLTPVGFPPAASSHGAVSPPRNHSVLSGAVCQGLASVGGGKRPGKQQGAQALGCFFSACPPSSPTQESHFLLKLCLPPTQTPKWKCAAALWIHPVTTPWKPKLLGTGYSQALGPWKWHPTSRNVLGLVIRNSSKKKPHSRCKFQEVSGRQAEWVPAVVILLKHKSSKH